MYIAIVFFFLGSYYKKIPNHIKFYTNPPSKKNKKQNHLATGQEISGHIRLNVLSIC